MNRRCWSLAAVVALGAGLCSLTLHPAAAQPGGPPKFRIGTYDARAVAVAYAHSEMNQKQVKEKMQELKDAEGREDAKRVKELKAWGESHQWLLHMQGFAGAPVENILAQMRDEVASVATAAQVEVVARKVDYADTGVEVVDITAQIVKLFKPTEKTLKMIRELRNRPAMEMADLEQALKHGHH
jgi:hypothetical protein